MSQQQLSGKVAFVTGSAKGLGRLFAETLANQGADIVLHYRSPSSKQDTEEAKKAIEEQYGRKVLIVVGDLSNLETIKECFQQIVSTFGHLDILVNNAGIPMNKSFLDITERDFDSAFAANTKAPFFVTQEALKILRDNGRIIFIATTLLGLIVPNYSVYCGSKASLEHFSRAIAREFGSRGITSNVIAPGPIDTPFFHLGKTPEMVERHKQMVPLGRLGAEQDFVSALEFIVSPKSGWVNAQSIFVNGSLATK